MSKTKVHIIEIERGRGQWLYEIKIFDSEAEAEDFCKEYNNKYNPIGETPDWYMYATIEGHQQMLR